MTRALLVLAVVLAPVLAPALARAQGDRPPPVEVTVEGVFGNAALIGDGYATVVVTARNVTREIFRGRMTVSAAEWGTPPERHAIALDLPPGETRRVQVTLFVGGNGATVEARYEVEGTTLGLASIPTAYLAGARPLVLLSDPPRLRAALLELQVTIPDPSAAPSYGVAAVAGERAVDVPIATVSLDPTTGDPIVPDVPHGWSGASLVVASTAMLARLGERESAALRDWVHAGGHLLVAPRTQADLGAPLVRELFGEVRPTDRPLLRGGLVPLGMAITELECGDRAATERFGCAAQVGFGEAYLLAFDATSPPFSERGETRDLVRSLAQRAVRATGPQLAFARGRDQFQYESWWGGAATFSRLRAALDPNEGYRPALGLVAIVLFLYVIVIGPLNFRFVLGRNAPTLALVTTPVAAFACALVMLAVGYLGKGVLTRYRRVEIVEVAEGSPHATSRTYAGLFLTRPAAVDLDVPAGAATMRLSSGGGDDGLVIEDGGDAPRLTGMRGGLWETLFVRTDRVVDLGGAITFTYESNSLVSVTNRTQVALRGALVIDDGRVFPVGDVEPGATRPIPRSWTTTIVPPSYYDDASDPTPGQLGAQLGLGEEHTPYVRGVLRLLGTSTTPSEPLLWARAEPQAAPVASPAFARDEDLRFVLLHPRPAYVPVGLAAVPVTPGNVWSEPSGPAGTELPPIEGPPADGGVP